MLEKKKEVRTRLKCTTSYKTIHTVRNVSRCRVRLANLRIQHEEGESDREVAELIAEQRDEAALEI